MATKLLRLDTSIFGAGGASTQLNDHLVKSLERQYGNLEILHRDLASRPLPHFTAGLIQALGKAPADRTAAEATQVALADQLIEELRAADILVVAAPMYNFTVPSTLKTWMDYVARAGSTFKYTESGPVGLLHNTRVYINTSRGGLHKGQPSDGIVPLLTNFFALLGLTDITVVYAEGLNMGEESRRAALTQAENIIDSAAA